MFRNYLATAWRILCRNRLFSIINILGLAIGMAACILILQYVNFELSYDQFNRNVKDIYRVYNDRYQNGKLIQHGTITYSAIGKAMQDDYPDVIDHARVMPFGKSIITTEDKKFDEQVVIAVDNSFMSMFSYGLIAGDVKTALDDPYAVILTRTVADRYFAVAKENYGLLLAEKIGLIVAVMPVVAGERLTAEAGRLAQQHRVWQLTAGHVISPEPAAFSS